MKARTMMLLLTCACGQGPTTGTDVVTVGSTKVQPVSVVSYLGATADTGPIVQVWVSDQNDYCAEISTMDPCHANFLAGEGPLAGTYLHLSARGTGPGTYPVPTSASAQLVVVRGVISVSRLSAISGTVTFSTIDAQGATGSYELTFDGGATASGRFQATGCPAFETLYAKLRLPAYHVSFGSTVSSTSCSAAATCNGRTRSVSCTAAAAPDWACVCSREDGSSGTCLVSAQSGNACTDVPESCCIVGF